MVTISVDVGHVDVDVDVDDFTDDELVNELESRNYIVEHRDDYENKYELTKEEIDTLQALLDEHSPRVGSIMWSIREKLVIR